MAVDLILSVEEVVNGIHVIYDRITFLFSVDAHPHRTLWERARDPVDAVAVEQSVDVRHVLAVSHGHGVRQSSSAS